MYSPPFPVHTGIIHQLIENPPGMARTSPGGQRPRPTTEVTLLLRSRRMVGQAVRFLPRYVLPQQRGPRGSPETAITVPSSHDSSDFGGVLAVLVASPYPLEPRTRFYALFLSRSSVKPACWSRIGRQLFLEVRTRTLKSQRPVERPRSISGKKPALFSGKRWPHPRSCFSFFRLQGLMRALCGSRC